MTGSASTDLAEAFLRARPRLVRVAYAVLGVQLISDGGGLVSAARRPVIGADHVARFLLGIAAKVGPGFRVDPRRINGSTGLVVVDDETVLGVMAIVADTTGRVVRIDLIRTPEKLRSVRANPTE